MLKAKVKVDVSGVPQQIRAIAKNPTVGEFAATELYNLSQQFTPRRDGGLIKSATIEAWKLSYNTPYARRLWYGDNLNFSQELSPSATSRWAEQVDKQKLAQSITDYLKEM